MQASLRSKVIAWLLVVAVLIGLAGFLGYEQVRARMLTNARENVASEIAHVRDELEVTNSVYLELVRGSMRALQASNASYGPPGLGPRVTVNGREVSDLLFGETTMANYYAPVDESKRLMGGTATLFVKEGGDFVRITTNVQKPDGSRAIGTILDPKGKAITAIREGNAFYGVVDILGRPCITGYEPIRAGGTAGGPIIGITYVGYPLETLVQVGKAIAQVRILEHGYVALLAENGSVIFWSDHVDKETVASAGEYLRSLGGVAREGKIVTQEDWQLEQHRFDPWGYTIVGGLYQPDAQRRTFQLLANVFGLAGAVFLAVMAVSYWLPQRLSQSLELTGALQREAEAARKVAERHREEAERAQAGAEQANRTKSAFLANMSHELRTPMNAIIGYSEMLIEDAQDRGNEGPVEDLQRIRSAGKHLLGLINDVLDISKIEAGKMELYLESFAVEPMLREVVATIEPLAQKNGNRLVLDLEEGAPSTMRADLTKLRQGLFNLLSNACKFTKQGTVTLRVRGADWAGVPALSFAVEDTGIGMTAAQLGNLFQAFTQANDSTTREFGGTGLGLVITRTFARMMGGEVSVESEPGRGTTFTMFVPVEVHAAGGGASAETTTASRAAEPAGNALSADSSAAPTSGRQLIITVDDDPGARDLITRSLTNEGFEVHACSTGAEALRIAASRRPAAVTLDLLMPEMDGWKVLAELKKNPDLAHVPVIMLTMVNQPEMGFALGVADYLTKPIDRERLVGVLAKHGVRSTGAGPTALVVEDDPATRDLTTQMLAREGWRSHTARNGLEALAAIATEVPALILLDLMMPEMDGFSFVEELQNNPVWRMIPVVVVTAKDITREDRTRLEGRVSGILQKGSFRREDLAGEIRRAGVQLVPGLAGFPAPGRKN